MRKHTKKVSTARVHIGGVGRVGTGVALALHAAGIGEISCNDPQVFETEHLEHSVYARRADVGRAKVHVLERFVAGRDGFGFLPLVAPNESIEVRPHLERADLIVSCANRLDARLYLERVAVELGIPIVQASIQDGRQAPAGLISLWAPDADCSCFGCLVPERTPRFRRGELLLPTVTGTIAAIAAHLIIEMLDVGAKNVACAHNVFSVDLRAYSIERLLVRARRSCAICGQRETRGA